MILKTFAWPVDSIQCRRGDYLLRREGSGRIRVYRVEDLVTLSRLVPYASDTLVEEIEILDSERPAYLDEIQLLLSSVEPDFASLEEGECAIQTGGLAFTGSRCENCRQFPSSSSRFYRPTVPNC